MGLFDRLFGRPRPEARPAPEAAPEAAPAPATPVLVALCRHGMNVPSAAEMEAVLEAAYPEGLPAGVERAGLAQPSWFKTQEIARSAAADVAHAMALRLGLSSYTHDYRVIEREGAARFLLVQLFREQDD
jgi:hypothetical protein